jgi:protein required for attachment to host cells
MIMAKTHQPRVWVLIADGEHARVVAPTAVEGQFATVVAFDSPTAHQRTRDMVSDRPGRVFESANVTRHAVVARSDPHEKAKHDFLVEVARLVDQHDQAGDFDRLVIAAPPHALHDLREALGTAAAAKVTGSLHKDLVKTPDGALAGHLAEWWLAPAG